MSGTRKAICHLSLAIMVVASGCTPRGSQPSSEPATAARNATRVEVRRSAVADQFYPGRAERLAEDVQRYLNEAEVEEISEDIIGLMAPHAGYEFSAGVAGYAYATIKGRKYDSVVLVGPGHRGLPRTGAALSGKDAWETPLGRVLIDQELNQKLLAANNRFAMDDFAHGPEHCLEVQLPFLQEVLDEFKIVPILMADFGAENTTALAEAIAAAVGEKKVLLVASTDMSHYPAQQQASRVDRAMLKTISMFKAEEIYAADERLLGQGIADLHCTLCGLGPLVTVMKAAQQLGAQRAKVLKYANSGDVDPRTVGRCVGYGAVAFVGKWAAAGPAQAAETSDNDDTRLSGAQQQYLLRMARQTIKDHLSSRGSADIHTDDPAMLRRRGVFVTLTKAGRLRGCIGQLEARAPLAQAVREAAVSAAFRDRRFRPISMDELKDIHTEISVLSPLRRVDNPGEIEVGKHGVLVQQGRRQGVFLPQVAPEQGWNREQMLTHLCVDKAGLPPDAWKKTATLYVFTAQVFGEEDEQ